MKTYKKDDWRSYALGVFPTLELLNHQPQRVRFVILSEKGEQNAGVAKIRQICQDNHIPIESNDRTIEKLSKKDNCYAIGVFDKYSEKLADDTNHVVLVNPGDMGNLGTIVRTMLGFGITDLALVRPAVDIYDPKVIRASMGAIFQMRFRYFDSFADYQAQYPSHYFYPMMLKGATSIHRVVKQEPYSIIMGNESSGLPDDFLTVGTSVLIDQTDRIDSLNLSIALGITLYEFTQANFSVSDKQTTKR